MDQDTKDLFDVYGEIEQALKRRLPKSCLTAVSLDGDHKSAEIIVTHRNGKDYLITVEEFD